MCCLPATARRDGRLLQLRARRRVSVIPCLAPGCGEILAHEAAASGEVVAVPGHALGLDSDAVGVNAEGAFADDGHCWIIKFDAVVMRQRVLFIKLAGARGSSAVSSGRWEVRLRWQRVER